MTQHNTDQDKQAFPKIHYYRQALADRETPLLFVQLVSPPSDPAHIEQALNTVVAGLGLNSEDIFADTTSGLFEVPPEECTRIEQLLKTMPAHAVEHPDPHRQEELDADGWPKIPASAAAPRFTGYPDRETRDRFTGMPRSYFSYSPASSSKKMDTPPPDKNHEDTPRIVLGKGRKRDHSHSQTGTGDPQQAGLQQLLKETQTRAKQRPEKKQKPPKSPSSFVETVTESLPALPISLFMAKIAMATTVLDPAVRPLDETLDTLLTIRRLTETDNPAIPALPIRPLAPSEKQNSSHFVRAERRAQLRTEAKQAEEKLFLDETRTKLESCPSEQRETACQQIVQSLFDRAKISGLAISTEKNARGVYYITIRKPPQAKIAENWKKRTQAITDILDILLEYPNDKRPLACSHNRIELTLPSEHPAQGLLQEIMSSQATLSP